MSSMSNESERPDREDEILGMIRDGDPKALNEAIARLYPILQEAARREIARRGVRTREAETLVDSVLIRCIEPASARCASDAQFLGYLVRSIINTLTDEGRRRRERQFPDDQGSSFGPVDRQEAPDAPLLAEESRAHDDQALDRFRLALAQSALTPRELELVEAFVVRGMAWEHVAASLELSSGAARTAMSRARTKLLPHLMQPIRAGLREEDWKILEATMIERRRPEEAAVELGMEPQDLLDRFLLTIFPVIDRCFGRHGMAMLRRLMHKPAGRRQAD